MFRDRRPGFDCADRRHRPYHQLRARLQRPRSIAYSPHGNHGLHAQATGTRVRSSVSRPRISMFYAATCDGGESQRYRTIEIAPSGPGVADCPGTTETKDCSLQVRLVLAPTFCKPTTLEAASLQRQAVTVTVCRSARLTVRPQHGRAGGSVRRAAVVKARHPEPEKSSLLRRRVARLVRQLWRQPWDSARLQCAPLTAPCRRGAVGARAPFHAVPVPPCAHEA